MTPQSTLGQSIQQKGIGGTLQSVGTGLAITAQGVANGDPQTITSLAGGIVVGAALSGVGGAISESLGAEELAAAANTAEGTTNSVNGARLGMQLSAEEAAGAQAPTSISSYSNHALQQIVGRDGGIGVSQAAVDDAFANPTAIQYVPSTYGPTFKYI